MLSAETLQSLKNYYKFEGLNALYELNVKSLPKSDFMYMDMMIGNGDLIPGIYD